MEALEVAESGLALAAPISAARFVWLLRIRRAVAEEHIGDPASARQALRHDAADREDPEPLLRCELQQALGELADRCRSTRALETAAVGVHRARVPVRHRAVTGAAARGDLAAVARG